MSLRISGDYLEFIQHGNREQCRANGTHHYEYSFGVADTQLRRNRGQATYYSLHKEDKNSTLVWWTDQRYCTNFKLILRF